jgi:hypothetical protein
MKYVDEYVDENGFINKNDTKGEGFKNQIAIKKNHSRKYVHSRSWRDWRLMLKEKGTEAANVKDLHVPVQSSKYTRV